MQKTIFQRVSKITSKIKRVNILRDKNQQTAYFIYIYKLRVWIQDLSSTQVRPKNYNLSNILHYE